MFTGLIEEIGVVKSLTRSAVARLVIASDKVSGEVGVGDSVAVDGVCLTVTARGQRELSFDVVPETLSRSTLADARAGSRMNLEASLRAGAMIGGHFVQGHVDGVGSIESIGPLDDSAVISVRAPREVLRYVVEKGSIAVNGVSLTVASCGDSAFSVAVIPHTLTATTLGLKRTGERVNLECDIIGKYVEKFLRGEAGGVSEESLRQAGFM